METKPLGLDRDWLALTCTLRAPFAGIPVKQELGQAQGGHVAAAGRGCIAVYCIVYKHGLLHCAQVWSAELRTGVASIDAPGLDLVLVLQSLVHTLASVTVQGNWQLQVPPPWGPCLAIGAFAGLTGWL